MILVTKVVTIPYTGWPAASLNVATFVAPIDVVFTYDRSLDVMQYLHYLNPNRHPGPLRQGVTL